MPSKCLSIILTAGRAKRVIRPSQILFNTSAHHADKPSIVVTSIPRATSLEITTDGLGLPFIVKKSLLVGSFGLTEKLKVRVCAPSSLLKNPEI